MQLLVRSSARRPWLVVALFAIVCAFAAVGAMRLEHEDDVLVFLPEDDDDVTLFRDVSDRFGSLRIALVGIAVQDGGDVLEAANLERIDGATKAFETDPAFSHVTSLTNVTDVVVGPAGAVVDRLVAAPPRSDAEHAELRARVLDRELVVGNLISSDARAAVLVLYLARGVTSSQAVERVRTIAERELGGFELHMTGAPFDAEAIYGAAREDVVQLSPVAALLLIAVVLLSFRDIVGVALTFATVGVGELVVIGGMGYLGERSTVLTSTMPILLLATGSAYAVHVLGRYYLEREQCGPLAAIDSAARIVSRPVAIAAWTTCVAFIAFLVMDVRPMRAFGLEVAAGTLVCWFTALTLIPAVLAIRPRKPQREQLLPLGGAMLRAWRFTARHRVVTIVGLLLATLASALALRDVGVKTEARAFLAEGSPAQQAQRFVEDRFGGSRFVQVLVEGELDDPVALRRVALLVERAGALPGVTGVTSVIDPIALVIDTLGGGRRLPATTGQSGASYLLLDGTPELSPLLADDHRATLVQIRVRGEAIPVVEALEAWIAAGGLELDPLARSTIVERLGWIARAAGSEVSAEALTSALDQAAVPVPEARWREARPQIVRDFVQGDDAAELPATTRARIELALDHGVEPDAALRDAIDDPDERDFYREQLARALADARNQLATRIARDAVAAAIGVSAGDPQVRSRLQPILEDLFGTPVAGAQGSVSARVTGEPALDRALSRSVARNQPRTMALGLVAVLLLLIVLFRSLRLALVCVAPALMTAVVLGGAMGLLDVKIDLSTAMLGAILTDTATDFGMHYLWYLRTDSPDEIVKTVGPIMIVSNLLVALGFFAFALGSSPVMHVFGTLSGATCVVSAVLTCLLVPAVWRWVDPRR